MAIEAEGCILRPIVEADAPAIAAACRDPEIAHWLPHIPQPYSIEEARSFVARATDLRERGDEMTYAIVDAEDTLLGVVGVRLTDEPPAVGYWIAAEARGRGIASAATRAISDWAFAAFGLARLALHAEPANHASLRVAEKCGFVRVPGVIKGAADRDLWIFELARHP